MHTKFDELGRFADPSPPILTSPADGPMHGYAIMTERHRPYEITAAGQEILAKQVKTMQQIVRVARLRTAMAWGP